MDNPILVEVTRGPQVESRHRGAVSVVAAEGTSALALGDVECRVFPRSAVKALQAIPLVETGIADRLGLTDAEIALACASHSGEPEHVEAAMQALARGGGSPSALHNNCSGKHAGFVCLACGMDEDPKGYVGPDHL